MPLCVFLCHSSSDKPAVRDLYHRLRTDGFDPWLDEEKLLPGQNWQEEIRKALHTSGVVVVCLSLASVTKEGYLQKEIKYALDVAEEKPEGAIFVVPLKLQECAVPDRLRQWQWASLPETGGYERLLAALHKRAETMEAASPVGAAPRSPMLRLRSEKATLSGKEAEVIIVMNNFYDSLQNRAGTGVAHQYHVQMLQGELVVVDFTTGLMWQKGVSDHNMTFEETEAYVGDLNAKNFAGFDDWRVPTLEEAMSLMTTPECGTPGEIMWSGRHDIQKGVYHINRIFDYSPVWTADRHSSGGWVLWYWEGHCDVASLDYNSGVRAVRSHIASARCRP